MCTTREVREALVDYFGDRKEFRERKFEETPEENFDVRDKNADYADALARMSDYISRLPDDDPTLTRLAGTDRLFCTGTFFCPADPDGGPPLESAQKAVHCAYYEDDEGCGQWLSDWADTVISEHWPQIAKGDLEEAMKNPRAWADSLRTKPPLDPLLMDSLDECIRKTFEYTDDPDDRAGLTIIADAITEMRQRPAD